MSLRVVASRGHRASGFPGRRALCTGIAGITTALLLAGCSADSAAPVPDIPEQNRALWTMPLDSYEMSGVELDAFDYAENLLTKPCMEEAGFGWDVPYQDVDSAGPITRNSVGLRLFTPDIAASVGYHFAVQETESSRAWKRFIDTPVPKAADARLTTCLGEIRESALPPYTMDMQVATELAADAAAAASTTRPVRDAAEDWKVCMAAVGIPDLPDTPEDMPTDWVADRFSVETTTSASTEEITAAIQDADCRESSGFSEALYAEQWKRQISALQDNADDLARVRDKIAVQNERVRSAIAENAPSAPATAP